MKILMLTPYLPYPPASGGQIRTLNLLKYLSKKNKITLVCLYKNSTEKAYVSYLKPYCESIFLCKRAEKPWQIKNIWRALFSPYPFLIVRNYSPEAAAVMQDLLNRYKYDVIHAETFYIMPHLPETPIPFVLVEQTIEYMVYKHFIRSLPFFIRPLFHTDIAKLKHWERFYWKKAQLVGTVSQADQKIIQTLEPQITPVIIPNGAGDDMIVNKILPKKVTNKPIFLFVGSFYWLQNTEAADYLSRKIFPILQSRFPEARLIIAGQNAAQKLKMIQTKNIEIVDVAPNDTMKIQKLYREATVFLAPIFGPGGTRLKILAAMASGLPIISTKIGVEGLDVKSGKHVLIANSEKEFGQRIKQLLSNSKLYDNLRINSYNLVKEKYSWEEISRRLEIVYKKIIISESRN